MNVLWAYWMISPRRLQYPVRNSLSTPSVPGVFPLFASSRVSLSSSRLISASFASFSASVSFCYLLSLDYPGFLPQNFQLRRIYLEVWRQRYSLNGHASHSAFPPCFILLSPFRCVLVFVISHLGRRFGDLFFFKFF